MAAEALYAAPPEALSFAPDTHVRAFVLRREQGNLLIYNAPGLASAAAEIEAGGGVTRQ
ncbi:hypothetical protein BH20ACT16_BH20ACT16_16240 [soil metagenome]